MPTSPRITGTFLDEITHDIPSQNWGPDDWRREFELYTRIGIDTVIIIRAGYRNRCIFPSRSIPGLLPIHDDLGRVFFDLADEHGLSLWLGSYDSGQYWLQGDWRKEVEINKAFVEEVGARYGGSRSFKGWYLCHETSRNELRIIDLFNHIGSFCKSVLDRPVLISPFPQGAKQFAAKDVLTVEQSLKEWDLIFSETRGAFDVCAFQDGQIHYEELPGFLKGIKALGERHGITVWSNLESFDRDMPIKFPPADWRNLRFKLESAAEVVEKIITFEFPHFMSPHSCYPAAHNLFKRYAEFAELQVAS